jgi:hypothetical protein
MIQVSKEMDTSNTLPFLKNLRCLPRFIRHHWIQLIIGFYEEVSIYMEKHWLKAIAYEKSILVQLKKSGACQGFWSQQGIDEAAINIMDGKAASPLKIASLQMHW